MRSESFVMSVIDEQGKQLRLTQLCAPTNGYPTDSVSVLQDVAEWLVRKKLQQTSSPLSQNVSVVPSSKQGNNCALLDASNLMSLFTFSSSFTAIRPACACVDENFRLAASAIRSLSSARRMLSSDVSDRTAPTAASKLQSVKRRSWEN